MRILFIIIKYSADETSRLLYRYNNFIYGKPKNPTDNNMKPLQTTGNWIN